MTDKSYQSFAEQALHYFRREHDEVRRKPIEGPTAWRGADLAHDSSWRITLDPAQRKELEGAVRDVRARGLDLGQVHRADFPLPGLEPIIDGWRRELQEGRGFLVLRGIPVESWGDEDSALCEERARHEAEPNDGENNEYGGHDFCRLTARALHSQKNGEAR